MQNLLIYKVYHNTNLLEKYPFVDDGLRYYVNTENMEYGPYLNEFCALLYNYEQIPDYIEYIGLEHYRRTFDMININNYQRYTSLIGNKNLCFVKEVYYVLGQSRYLQLMDCLDIESIILKYLNDNNINLSLMSDLRIRREMFIMHKTYMIEMIHFVHNIIQYIFKELCIYNINDLITYIDNKFKNQTKQYIHRNNQNDKYRLFAYIIEYLIDLWIRKYMIYIPINKINKFNI